MTDNKEADNRYPIGRQNEDTDGIPTANDYSEKKREHEKHKSKRTKIVSTFSVRQFELGTTLFGRARKSGPAGRCGVD